MLLCKGSLRSEAKTRPAVAAVAVSEAGAAASVTSEILQRAYPDYTYKILRDKSSAQECMLQTSKLQPAAATAAAWHVPGIKHVGCVFMARPLSTKQSSSSSAYLVGGSARFWKQTNPLLTKVVKTFFFTTSGSRQMPHKACKYCFL